MMLIFFGVFGNPFYDWLYNYFLFEISQRMRSIQSPWQSWFFWSRRNHKLKIAGRQRSHRANSALINHLIVVNIFSRSFSYCRIFTFVFMNLSFFFDLIFLLNKHLRDLNVKFLKANNNLSNGFFEEMAKS